MKLCNVLLNEIYDCYNSFLSLWTANIEHIVLPCYPFWSALSDELTVLTVEAVLVVVASV